MPSLAQTRAIHGLRRQIKGLDDESYRDLLDRRFSVVSSKDLTDGQAIDLIDELKRLAGQTPGKPMPGRRAATTMSGRFAPVLRALWLAAWNLAIVKNSDDAALLAFVERQTGVSHDRFLTDPQTAARAIEGLKAWISREANVIFPTQKQSEDQGLSLATMRKQEIVHAIVIRLNALQLGREPTALERAALFGDAIEYGASKGLPKTISAYTDSHWDRLANLLGARLRTRFASKSAKKGAA